MLDNFVSVVEDFLEIIKPEWLALGTLIVCAFIMAIGLVMTIFMARELSCETSCLQVIRSRARRNVIFTVTFIFCTIITMAIFYMFPGEVLLYLALPALVLIWAFICEAMFESIDDRNRRKANVKVCYCMDGDCDLENLKAKEPDKKMQKEEKHKEEEKHREKKEERQKEKAVAEEKARKEEVRKEDARDAKVSRKEEKARAVSKEEARLEQIREQLKRAGESEQDRAELEQWRDEIKEGKSLAQSEDEELRRRKFEEERKNLALLARNAEAAQFGNKSESRSIYDRASARVALAQKSASIAESKPSTPKPSTSVLESKAAHITAAKPVAAVVVAPTTKPVEVKTVTVTKIDDADTGKDKEHREVTTTTTTRTSQTVTASTSTDTKFTSLQAKLDLLRKDTARTREADVKVEPQGKHNEGEVRSALDDLLKSMRARNNEE